MFRIVVLPVFSVLLLLLVTGLNDYFSIKGEQEAALSLLVLGLAFIVILFTSLSGTRILYSSPVRIFLLVFGGYLILAGLSSLLNPFNDELAWGYRYYLPSLVIYFCGLLGFRYWLQHISLASVINILRFALLFNTLTILAAYFLDTEIFVFAGDRASGINLNANSAGYIAVLALSFELFSYSRSNHRWQRLFIPLILLAIFVTFSKSAYAMLLAVLVLYLLYLRRVQSGAKWIRRLMGFTILLIVSGYFLMSMSNTLTKTQFDRVGQFTDLLSGEITEESTTNRSALVGTGWKKILEAPVMGLGFKSMSKMGPNTGGVHNQYLLLWGEGGILALLLFLIFIFYYYTKAAKLPLEYRFLVRAIIFSVTFYSLTNHNMYSNKSLMLLLAFLAILFHHFEYVRNFRPVGVR